MKKGRGRERKRERKRRRKKERLVQGKIASNQTNLSDRRNFRNDLNYAKREIKEKEKLIKLYI